MYHATRDPELWRRPTPRLSYDSHRSSRSCSAQSTHLFAHHTAFLFLHSVPGKGCCFLLGVQSSKNAINLPCGFCREGDIVWTQQTLKHRPEIVTEMATTRFTRLTARSPYAQPFEKGSYRPKLPLGIEVATSLLSLLSPPISCCVSLPVPFSPSPYLYLGHTADLSSL